MSDNFIHSFIINRNYDSSLEDWRILTSGSGSGPEKNYWIQKEQIISGNIKSGMQVIRILILILFLYICYIKKMRGRGGFSLQSRLYSLYCKSIFKSFWTRTNWVRVLEICSHNTYLHCKMFLKIFLLIQRLVTAISSPQIFTNNFGFCI